MTIAWLFSIGALALWLGVVLLVWMGTDRPQINEDDPSWPR